MQPSRGASDRSATGGAGSVPASVVPAKEADRPREKGTGAAHGHGYNPAMPSSYTSGDEYLAPARIHVDREAGRLEIDWADGHRTVYDTVTLRWLCPCAYCRGEAGMPGWLDSSPTLTPDQTRLVDVQLVGTYALAPTWADGHHTGYYTFEQLRANCPCPEDEARRTARTAVRALRRRPP